MIGLGFLPESREVNRIRMAISRGENPKLPPMNRCEKCGENCGNPLRIVINIGGTVLL